MRWSYRKLRTMPLLNERRLRQEPPLETRQAERSDELLELARENNQMLRWIMSYLMHEA